MRPEGDPLCDGVLELCHVGAYVVGLSRFWSAVQKNRKTFRTLSTRDVLLRSNIAFRI